jgi:hypothetical protein
MPGGDMHPPHYPGLATPAPTRIPILPAPSTIPPASAPRRLERQRKKERRKRREAKVKARLRAAQLAQSEGIGEEEGGPDALFSLAAIKVGGRQWGMAASAPSGAAGACYACGAARGICALAVGSSL